MDFINVRNNSFSSRILAIASISRLYFSEAPPRRFCDNRSKNSFSANVEKVSFLMAMDREFLYSKLHMSTVI